ncbi:MAG: hypothetical protein QOJ60_871 [Actinomycetota bacterium]|jgi:DNA-binding response OmpR family regulator|nr:hypothetical protein [Actinomycetota bacterium]
MRPTAIVVDDHASFRAFAARLLTAAGFDVVAEADGAATGLDQVRELRPDLVLLDVVLPDGDGVEVARSLGDQAATHVLLTSSRTTEELGDAVAAYHFVTKADLTIAGLARLAAG